MIGYHAVPVIADAYMKGLKGFDAEEALKAMTSSAEYGPYGGLQHYMKLGYVPIDLEPEAASKTVEYAFDDWTIARMAEKMGKKDIAARYYKRAQNYRNSFDVKTGFLRAKKSDGSSASRSIPCCPTSAATTPKAARGSTRGICRTITQA
jgi:putative alpha-1,2-mannosidase